MNLKIGDKSKFSFSKGETITDIVDDTDFEYIVESNFGVCPECGHQLSKRQTFKIVKLIVIGNKKHFVGYSDKGHTLKIPKKIIPKELVG